MTNVNLMTFHDTYLQANSVNCILCIYFHEYFLFGISFIHYDFNEKLPLHLYGINGVINKRK